MNNPYNEFNNICLQLMAAIQSKDTDNKTRGKLVANVVEIIEDILTKKVLSPSQKAVRSEFGKRHTSEMEIHRRKNYCKFKDKEDMIQNSESYKLIKESHKGNIPSDSMLVGYIRIYCQTDNMTVPREATRDKLAIFTFLDDHIEDLKTHLQNGTRFIWD
ncbi:hypothetical protein TVAG_077400 [Trichomonas vaginalis G3]|uniref:Uncharacterized protein n=1 Tax=Trichomonas vaginalis (strain ATCC PRA-98 / G3) TaxID=412133 RepID=A2E2U7_TRIV3|nr:hypothetical protein TVAGG3_0896480 [Trichomonas vaginalis G3]EAY13002.1 hypothetical protein TVAG_077400 [Trichomonas vaginalis G3]KAI5503107.1 hypothetical protein TVAGG3_0896480 [Trichomonas vaginalis G3]|eukprot:XP_001325225.1 hypothetical protein [Trichomonas vaginalis G3]